MLISEPEQRISFEDLFKDPWIVQDEGLILDAPLPVLQAQYLSEYIGSMLNAEVTRQLD